MPIKKNEEIELTIESLAFGGEGIGRYKTDQGSLAVFVEDTVPGDVVRARIGSTKRNYAYGYLTELLKQSPQRIEPRCKHFGTCGGCRLQYLRYDDQLKIKEQHVRDALRRIGGFEESVVLPIIGCEAQWFYRNKMEFSFGRSAMAGQSVHAGYSGRTVTDEILLGLHVRRRHHDVIELMECFLLESFVGEFVMVVRDFFRGMDRDGRLKVEIQPEMKPVSLIIRVGKNTGETMVNLVFENGEPDFLKEFVKLVRGSFGEERFSHEPAGILSPSSYGFKKNLRPTKLTSIYFTNIINTKGRPKATKEKLLWGKRVIHEELHLANGAKLKFGISPQAFFQPNTRQAEVLYSEVLKAAQLRGLEIVFDLFCGAGTLGSFCAQAAKKVFGIEINKKAVLNARANAELNGIKNIEFIAGDVVKILAPILAKILAAMPKSFIGQEVCIKPDIVIVDPPRGGLAPKAVELVAALRAKRIVYVSCNPASLARDLKLFIKTGYSLVSVQPVDMFPQTYHIECVALLTRFTI